VVAIKPPQAQFQDIAASLNAQLVAHGVAYHQLNFSNAPHYLFISAYQLLLAIKRFQPDVIHLHTDHPEYLFSLIKPFVKGLVVRTIRNTVIWPTSRIRGRFTEWSISDAVTVHFSEASEVALNQRRSDYRLSPPSTMERIPNGINITANGIVASDLIQYHQGRINLGFVGRLTYQKGLDILLASMKRLPEHSVRLHVIGDGEDREQLETEAQSISQEVIFYGGVPHARQCIRQFDYLVIPSRYEGFAIISLEGQIEKVPVIAARAPGLVQTLDKEWPLSFESENSEELAAMLLKAINQEIDGESAIDMGYSNALQYTMDKQVDRYTALYKQYLNQTARS
jgi:glycosyltransferase involved in cell wall biosynthesis